MEAISIKGINRDPRADEQGMCNEVINLRHKDGSWRPVGKKTVVAANGAMTIDRVFIHTIDPDTDSSGDQPGGKNYIGYDSNTGKIYQWELSNPMVRTELGDIGTGKAGKIRFEALKNIVIVIDEADRRTSYLLWKDGIYTFMENRYPELLDVLYSVSTVSETRGFNYYDNNSFLAAYGQWLAEKREAGYEEGYVMIRYGYEMYDGSVVMHSAPMLICLGGMDGDETRRLRISLYNPTSQLIAANFGKINFVFLTGAKNTETLAQLNGAYKHTIKRINFYVTKPVPSNDTSKVGTIENDVLDNGLANGTPFINAIDDELYYLIHSVNIADIVLGNSSEIAVGSKHPYEALPIMPGDDMSHHSISGSASMIYNGRMMVGDIASKLFPGYWPSGFFVVDGTSATVPAYRLEMYTTILMEEGQKVVRRISDYENTHDIIKLPAAISYPDIRASKIELYKRNVSTGTAYKIAEWQLSKHSSQNFAYHLIEDDLADGQQTLTTSSFTTPATTPAVDDEYSDYNMVKMSALNNPFHFPVENSYPVGLSQVIAFTTMAIPISQGQYGQYPIIVFTTSGMWSMELGQGRTTIASVVPLNDLVCINPKAIAKAGKSIIFPTQEGLILLQGGDDVLISQPLRGTPVSPIALNAELQLFVSHQDGINDLVNLAGAMSTDGFSTYLAGAAIGYDSNNREIIVSNRSYNYSYVYSLVNNVWTKITERFKYFIADWPSTFAVDTSNSIIDIGSEDTTAVDTLIITRPMHYGELLKITRLGMKASIDAAFNKVTGLYLFGSVDGRNWKMVTGMQKAASFNNPYVSHSLMTFREAILVIAGNFQSSTFLREINIDLKAKYDNKKIR